MSGFVDELEAEARARFVRWDPALWRELLAGPVPRLGQALAASSRTPEQAEELLRDYLRLSAEGIGLGYLYPASAGRQNFFTLAWSDLIPRLMPAVADTKRAAVLAQLWNLGENLEAAPPWVQRVFCRVGRDLSSLEDIESRLRQVASSALDAPTRPLGSRARTHWVDMSHEDTRFLPGAVHFLAPTVVCVHDRHRKGVAGREGATQGVWLAETPVMLGAMGCGETLPATSETLPPLEVLEALDALEQRDPRAGDWLTTGANPWRAVATMHTSQLLAVLLPE